MLSKLVCLTIVSNGEGVLPLVKEKVLEVVSLEEHSHLKSRVVCPWSAWNSHHLVMSCLRSRLLGFYGHLIVFPIPFMMETTSMGSMLRLYSEIQSRSAGAAK